MKILFYTGAMGKGGAERVIANIANEFIKNNEVIIVTSTNEKSEYQLNPNIKFLTLDKNKAPQNFIVKNIKRLVSLKRIIRKNKPNICISFLPEPSYRLMAVNFFKRYKTIISIRNDPKVEYNTWFEKLLVKLLYSRADGFVFQTEEAKNFFSIKIQERATIIPNPINEKFLCKPFDKMRDKSIVTVGRLTSQKNHKLLIDAFYRVQLKYTDYILKIYGDGELKKELIKYCKKLGINNKVKFMGNVENVKNEIYKSSMFVLTSNYEGMPNALMEAMALGVPCISIDCPCGGPKYLLADGRGILVSSKKELVHNMNKLIKDSSKAKTISKKASEFCKDLTCEKIANEWLKYISKVIKG